MASSIQQVYQKNRLKMLRALARTASTARTAMLACMTVHAALPTAPHRRLYLRILFGAALCFFSVSIPMHHVFAEMVDLKKFIDETNSVLQWDYFRQQGLIWKNSDVIAFSPAADYVIYNYNQKIEIENIHYSADGQLLVSDASYRTLKKFFSESKINSNNAISAIFIDAGHGGKDSGAVGSFSTTDAGGDTQKIYEKDVVLRVANDLARRLTAAFPNKDIIRSRSEDIFLSLQQRTKLANAIKVTPGESILFISIHANASLNRGAAGYEVWYLPPDYRRNDLVDARTVGVKDSDLLSILNSIKDEEYTIESVLLAQRILKGLDVSIGSISKNRGIKQESWFVVRQAKMPSVLVEVGFVSNPEEARRLSQKGYLEKVVTGIYDGVVTFINEFE